jgi:hypothetical protein
LILLPTYGFAYAAWNDGEGPLPHPGSIQIGGERLRTGQSWKVQDPTLPSSVEASPPLEESEPDQDTYKVSSQKDTARTPASLAGASTVVIRSSRNSTAPSTTTALSLPKEACTALATLRPEQRRTIERRIQRLGATSESVGALVRTPPLLPCAAYRSCRFSDHPSRLACHQLCTVPHLSSVEKRLRALVDSFTPP